MTKMNCLASNCIYIPLVVVCAPLPPSVHLYHWVLYFLYLDSFEKDLIIVSCDGDWVGPSAVVLRPA